MWRQLLIMVGMNLAFAFNSMFKCERIVRVAPLGVKLSNKELRKRYPKAGGKLSVVLTKDAPPWGNEGDVLRVSRGFTLNYLMPNQLAQPASEEIIAEAEAKRAALQAEEEAKREEAAAIGSKLLSIGKFKLQRKSGDDGKLFGSVTPADIIGVVNAAASCNLDAPKIILPPAKDIDHLGDYPFSIQLYKDISVDLVLTLTAA